MRVIVNLIFIFFLALLFARHVRADPVAPSIFGQWEPVTVREILKPVPEYVYVDSRGSIGSATREYRGASEVLDGCPIYEKGKVIGWSLACLGEWK